MSENLDKVRQAMSEANRVALGSDLNEGVPIDFNSADGNEYKGTVYFRRPDMKAYMKMGAVKSEYLRVAGVKDISLVDGTVKFMAHVMGTLAVVISRAPAWLLDSKGKLDLEGVKEPEVLYHLFGKYEEWEDSFRKPIQRADAGDSKDTEPAENVDTTEVLRESTAD
jgi:hypothetical protein